MFRFLAFVLFLLTSSAASAQSLNDKIRKCDLAFFDACEDIVAEITKRDIPETTKTPLLQFYQTKLQAAHQFRTSTDCPYDKCDAERQKHRQTVSEIRWPFGSTSLDDLLERKEGQKSAGLFPDIFDKRARVTHSVTLPHIHSTLNQANFPTSNPSLPESMFKRKRSVECASDHIVE